MTKKKTGRRAATNQSKRCDARLGQRKLTMRLERAVDPLAFGLAQALGVEAALLEHFLNLGFPLVGDVGLVFGRHLESVCVLGGGGLVAVWVGAAALGTRRERLGLFGREARG
jgi:hypothetical protein